MSRLTTVALELAAKSEKRPASAPTSITVMFSWHKSTDLEIKSVSNLVRYLPILVLAANSQCVSTDKSTEDSVRVLKFAIDACLKV